MRIRFQPMLPGTWCIEAECTHRSGFYQAKSPWISRVTRATRCQWIVVCPECSHEYFWSTCFAISATDVYCHAFNDHPDLRHAFVMRAYCISVSGRVGGRWTVFTHLEESTNYRPRSVSPLLASSISLITLKGSNREEILSTPWNS